MIKNKLIIKNIPIHAQSTDALTAEAILNSAKEYLDSEGFTTSNVTTNGTEYFLSAGKSDYTTKIAFKLKPGTTTYYYTGQNVNGKTAYGSSSSFKFANTPLLVISYFYTNGGFGIGFSFTSSGDDVGFTSWACFLCKSATGVEYSRYSSALRRCDTGTQQKIDVSDNKFGIDTAVLYKVSVDPGMLAGLYIIQLPNRTNPIDQQRHYGGLFVYLDGYGKFLCLYKEYRTLWAFKLDD